MWYLCNFFFDCYDLQSFAIKRLHAHNSLFGTINLKKLTTVRESIGVLGLQKLVCTYAIMNMGTVRKRVNLQAPLVSGTEGSICSCYHQLFVITLVAS